MREKKFRGWNGKRIFPAESLSQSPNYRKWLGKADVELMQYTGLKDKDGTEIYEGYVVRFNIPRLDPEHREYKNQVGLVKSSNMGNLTFGTWCWKYARDIEIIGNIHEHPELLGAKTEV